MRVPVDDIEMEVAVVGDGEPAVVLVHGLGGSHRVWSGVAPRIGAETRAVAPDLRGCGRSTRGTAPWSLARAADDIEAMMRTLGPARYVAVGHSLGGVLVEEILVRRPPSLAGAVLLSTSSRLSEKATENWRRIADVVERKGLSDSPASQARGFSEGFVADHPDVVADYARESATADPAVYAEQARAASSYDYTEALAGVACPVIVVQGLADRLTPPGGSVLMHRALPPSARIEMVEGVGHNIPIEAPDKVAEIILGLVREIRATD